MFGEKGIIDAVLQYWNDLREGKTFPPEEDVDPDMLDEAWDHCFLIYPREEHFGFTHIGPAVREAYGSNRTIECRLFMESPAADGLTERYREVLETKKPLVDTAEFINLQDELVRFKQCLLPLGSAENGEVTSILGCLHYSSR